MNQARKVIHCELADRLGLTGAGIGVAVIDTGEGGSQMGGDKGERWAGAGSGGPRSPRITFARPFQGFGPMRQYV